MLKLFGSICLFLACTGYGLIRARYYRERPRQLQQLRLALQGLETEIEYAQTPLPVAFVRIASRINGPVAGLCAFVGSELAESSRAVDEIFKTAFTKFDQQLYLTKEDREVICLLAATLGISDRKDQLKHLKLASSNLHQLEQRAAEDRTRLEKMWNYLGPLLGALIVVLLY
ncbi:MAG: spoIIIAB [Bacilli bacterium]|nr:spoIIIAB [Bacilli bacterium]